MLKSNLGIAAFCLGTGLCCTAPARADDLALFGYGPAGPSVPLNELHWRLDRPAALPYRRGPDFTDVPPQCVIVTRSYDSTSIGNVLYRYPVCPR